MSHKAVTVLAVVLIALGAFGLARGKFSYTEDTHEAKVGSLELALKEKQTVSVPQWVAIGAIAVGAVLLVFARRK
jgi:TRAP-type C4-dicarboxylate transport system permease small subunit